MKKNIKKYSASLIVIVLSIMLGYAVYAEGNTTSATVSVKSVSCTMEAKLCPDGVTYVGRTLPNCEFAKCPGVQDDDKKVGDKDDVNSIRNVLKTNGVEIKAQLEQMIQSVKNKREEFKTELTASKEQVTLKIAEMKTNFKESLSKIKDENKKISAEKIVSIIQDLNTKSTDNLSNKIDQIENVLVSIESRISKAESNGLDVTLVKGEVEKAKTAIKDARDSVSAQSKKVYTTNVTDETTLKAEMKKLRDTFSTDIKAVHEKVKQAHVAVRITATTLAKIPKIDEEVEVTTEVETNSTTTNN